jgi:hypothetical protein
VSAAAAVFRRALVYGIVISVGVAAVGALVFGLTMGSQGTASAAIAGAIGIGLTAITVGSLLLGERLVRDDPGNPIYFAVVFGGWILKFALFLVAVLLLRDAPFADPLALFVCVVAVVIGSVIGDVIAAIHTRVPYVEPRSDRTGS